jgi:predicted ATP-grasp superfamily ATP-dependent carboligase
MIQSTAPLLAHPALVAGLDLNGLGVLRALESRGVRTIALDTDFDKPTAATRFGEKRRVNTLSGPEFVNELLALRSRFDNDPVLILTQEASVVSVAAEHKRLSGAYRFTMPSQELMDDLMDKLRFQALAERHGFPIPRAVRVTAANGFEALADLGYPCVVKPPTKDPEYGARFAKAYKVFGANEVMALWAKMREVVDEVIVQEWIEGSDSDVYFCLQYRPLDGSRAASFVGRKICQWPLLVGGTASCMPAPDVADELIALTDGFFARTGFVGIGSMEYKRDPRDGRFYMIEPTVGRTDYQEEIAVLNGVNIPYAAYCGALGLPLPKQFPRKRLRAWRDPVGYARARGAGAPDPIRRFSPNVKIYDAYFRVNDPMPYLSLKLGAVHRRLKRAKCPMAKPARGTL